jgi:hypothetical protein
MDNKITSHIIKGSILSGIAVLLSIIVNVFNLYEVAWINYINYAVMIGGLIYSCILFANENDNKVSFGNIFAHGFKTTSVIIVITVIYTFLSLKLLFPDMQDKILEISRKKMAENPQMTDEMIEQALAMTKKFFMPFAIGGAIIGTGFIGAISSLIGAGVAKKLPVDPFSEPTA